MGRRDEFAGDWVEINIRNLWRFISCRRRVKLFSKGALKSLLFGGTGQLRTQKAFNLCEDFAIKGDLEFMLN